MTDDVFFLQNTSCIRKPQVISGGEVRTPYNLPLDSPLYFQTRVMLKLGGKQGDTSCRLSKPSCIKLRVFLELRIRIFSCFHDKQQPAV